MTKLDAYRRILLAIFIVSVVGVTAELLLLGHFEGGYQKIPLVLLVMSLLVVAWCSFDRSSVSFRAFQITMSLFVVAGAAGLWLHYRADPQVESPALAPGAMIQLGMLGMAYTFRHDVFER